MGQSYGDLAGGRVHGLLVAHKPVGEDAEGEAPGCGRGQDACNAVGARDAASGAGAEDFDGGTRDGLAGGVEDRDFEDGALKEGDGDGQFRHDRAFGGQPKGELAGVAGSGETDLEQAGHRGVKSGDVAVFPVAGEYRAAVIRHQCGREVVEVKGADVADGNGERHFLAAGGEAVLGLFVDDFDGVNVRNRARRDGQFERDGNRGQLPFDLHVRGVLAGPEHCGVVDEEAEVDRTAGGDGDVGRHDDRFGIGETQPLAAEDADGGREVEMARRADVVGQQRILADALENRVLNEGVGGGRDDGLQERRGAGDVRGGHRRAAQEDVVAVWHERAVAERAVALADVGAEDVDAGGGEVDGGGAVVREIRDAAVMVGRGDDDDVVEPLRHGGRVVGRHGDVLGVVARRADEEHVVVLGLLHHAVEDVGVERAAPAVVVDGDAGEVGVLEGARDGGGGGVDGAF